MGRSFKLNHPLSLIHEGVKGVQSFASKNVVVLAKNFSLSRPQFDVLNKGLTFVPSLNIGRKQKIELEWDLQNYHRKIQLAWYFRNSNKKEIPPFTENSNWTPPRNKLPIEIINLIEEDKHLLERYYRSFKENFNLTIEEVKAIKELKNAKHIIIKPADKGATVVILSREQYDLEVQRQLNDTVYYKKLDKPIFMETIPLIDNILNTLKKKKFINEKQRKYLKGTSQPRERRFYVLPKIHKDPKSWTVPFEVPPGRPIVSDCGSETYYTAEYIDYYLNPLSNRHPAYLKDTYHFIQIVKNLQIPSNSYFFSMDVVSLYTNIDILSGINAVKKCFSRYPDPKRPDAELLQLLEINLTRNDFVYNGEFYLQIKGTAMGKRFAPAYANIFMANWEEEVFRQCHIKPFHYLRFLDDIWGIWTGSRSEFQQFLDTLNSHDTSIQLKAEIHENSIDFLDTTVYKGPDFQNTHKLDIKVFFKQTDTHALLHRTSFHPQHTFRGIVKSQILRFKKICTRQETFMEAVHILFKALYERGYTRSFLRQCFKTFQQRKERDDGNLIPLITTFSSTSLIMNQKVKNNFGRLIDIPGVIPNSKVISAYRRNKNLKDVLVRAKLPSLQTQQRRQLLDADFCNLQFIRNSKEKTIIKISQGFSPRSANCIYLIFCAKCGIKYVGETKNSLSTRMYQHRYNIRHRREVETPLVKHFLIHGLNSVRMAGLQKHINWTDFERKKFERHWIYLLGTREPFGLNMRYR